jgi:glutaredoxin-like protein NrdH
MTCRCLRSAGIPFDVVDVTEERDALEFVRNTLGYSEAPVVVVHQQPVLHWAGFRPDLINELGARLHGAAPIAAPVQVPQQGIGRA